MSRCGLEVLALVGLRCTGKSAVGRRVAQRAGARFVDLDEWIAADLGSPSAGEAIERLGIARFRNAEERALEAALERRDAELCVLATGGGVVTSGPSRDRLRAKALAVWLRAPAEVLAARLERDAALRPSLTDAGSALDELRRLEAERSELYRAVSRRAVDAAQPVEAAVDEVLRIWRGDPAD